MTSLVSSTYDSARRIINAGLIQHAVAAVVFLMMLLIVAATVAKADDKPVIVAFGDSLTAGFGLEDRDSFPVRLAAALRREEIAATVINSGVSGDTTAGGRARLEWSLPETVDLVIVELGANDGLRGIDPSDTEANLDWILKRLEARRIPVLLTGMLAPPNLGREYAEAFNPLFARLAARHGVAFYPFFLEGVAADPAFNQSDGLHPNAAGVARIVSRITPYVIRALEPR